MSGDGEWLIHSILSNNLVICCDGSYMPDLSKTTCSGAFILHCTATGNEISGCFVDESIDSNNYRGELLGALGPLLILRAAFESNPSLASSPETIATINQLLHCDNNGVVGHGNDQQGPLKQDQTQADLIRLLKSYSRRLPFRTKWIHVKGHSDRYQAFSQLTLIEQLNVRCDAMAKKCLIDTIASRVFIVPTFPDEDITLAIGANKIRSSTRKAIYSHWGRSVAKNLFSKRDKVLRSSFDFIYWDCMNKVMSSFVKTFQDWVTRHISDFNGCNVISPASTPWSKTSVPAATKRMKTPSTSSAARTQYEPSYTMKGSTNCSHGWCPTTPHLTWPRLSNITSRAEVHPRWSH